jgi:hypothetical protein
LSVRDCGFEDIEFLPLEDMPVFQLSLFSLHQGPTANLVAVFHDCLKEVVANH